ncbi:MAG TPA: outer membrane lipoprotein chaperone LolA [Vicinamibacterales bacterium]|nr:outer membrane lipoprotein chaperone LolA [Vicinamibacterales bacterium]
MHLVITLLILAVGPTQAQTPNAQDLARRIQAHYDTVNTFSAQFTQSYADGLFKSGGAEKGELKLKKPNRFRMVYTDPERKVFVADGSKLYSHFPADKLGTIQDLPKDGEGSTALLFIAGRGSLVNDFDAAMAGKQVDGEWQLVFTPRRRQAEFKTLTLMVDRSTLALRGYAWTDHDGGTTTTRLSDLRENVPVADSEFTLKFPPGTHIEK